MYDEIDLRRVKDVAETKGFFVGFAVAIVLCLLIGIYV